MQALELEKELLKHVLEMKQLALERQENERKLQDEARIKAQELAELTERMNKSQMEREALQVEMEALQSMVNRQLPHRSINLLNDP